MTDDKHPTQNHNLPRPEPGSFEGTWGTEIMNDDLTQKVEERMIVRDELANINNYEPYDGAIFWATDTGEPIFKGDSETWGLANAEVADLTAETLSTDQVGSETSPVHGIYAEQTTHKGKPWFDITAFGAVEGDETEASSNTTAIQNAFDAAAGYTSGASANGTVYIPAGEWYFDDTIEMDGYHSVFGEGRRMSNLNYEGTGAALEVDGQLNNCQNFSVINTGGDGDIGIHMDNENTRQSERSHWSWVEVRSFNEANWKLEWTWWQTFINCVSLSGDGIGFEMGNVSESGTQVNGLTFVGCVANGMGEEGWHIGNCNAVSILGGGAEGCGGPGIFTNSSFVTRGLNVIGTYSEHNDVDGDWHEEWERAQMIFRGIRGFNISPGLISANNGIAIDFQRAQSGVAGLGTRIVNVDTGMKLGHSPSSDWALDMSILHPRFQDVLEDFDQDRCAGVVYQGYRYEEQLSTSGSSGRNHRMYKGTWSSAPHDADGSEDVYIGTDGHWYYDDGSWSQM